MPVAVCACDLDVVINRRPIVREINLKIEVGSVVAVLGANGSGKSTLVKAIVGLNPISKGSVELFGRPIPAFKDWQRVGYVPQRSTITQGVPASVQEVVAAGRIAHRKPFTPMRPRDRDAVADAIASVGLTDRRHQTVSALSGGQQQRVLVARALATAPDLLVLDEPNAGVDLPSQLAIANTIAERAAAGATVVVVLHELGPFEPLINRTIVMRDGRITYDGDPVSSAFDHGDHHHDSPPREGGRSVRGPFDTEA